MIKQFNVDMEVSFLSAAITLSSNLKITGYKNT